MVRPSPAAAGAWCHYVIASYPLVVGCHITFFTRMTMEIMGRATWHIAVSMAAPPSEVQIDREIRCQLMVRALLHIVFNGC